LQSAREPSKLGDETIASEPVKEPRKDERELRCFRKRRYRTQGDALDAAMVAGVERQRKAYLCPHCRLWHLTTASPA